VNKTSISIGILVVCTAGRALVTAYHVGPRTAAMSGWTRLPPHPSYYVSQTVTCCWNELDSTCYVQPFPGCACASEAEA
jgi:hypothetical protein